MNPSRRMPLLALSTLLTAVGGCGSNNPPPTQDSGPGPVEDSGGGGQDSGGGTDATVDASGDGGGVSEGSVADAVPEAAPGDNGIIQAAINQAVAAGGTSRVYIQLQPGTYREVVCVPANAPPITLYSTNADASQTVVVFNNYNGLAKAAGTPANPCTPNASGTTYGTAGSATFSAFGDGFQAKNITFQNDVSDAVLAGTAGSQAVALMTEADKVILDNVRILSHQDTFYAETASSDAVVRTYVTSSFIDGDVDFIFGGATLVVDGSTIEFVSDRKTSGQALSPSTDSRSLYGELVNNSMFTGDANAPAGKYGLGRAWDRSCTDLPTYLSTCVAAGHYPNGQALVRGSTLDDHINPTPWLPSATTSRPFCDEAWACEADAGDCPANRLFEYQNTGAGAAASTSPADAASETPACSDKRPQLSDTDAANEVVLKYLAQAGSLAAGLTTDNWDPTTNGVGDVSTFTATYTVSLPASP
jgi:pectinesterase